jgi:restriction system protein
MAVPDYQSLMLPLLKYAGDGEEYKIRDAIEHLAEALRLSEEEKRELLPSGQQAVFNNRVGWTRTYLKKAGLLASGRKGYFSITQKGQDVLREKPPFINVNFLKRYKEFNNFYNKDKPTLIDKPEIPEIERKKALDPEEFLEIAYQELHNELVSEVLSIIKKCSASFFESLVVDVLTKMGYGGSSTVPRPEIQKFAGALIGKKAKKGVFITTSTFSREAIEYADFTGNIVLIDGETLARLMIEYNVGVSKVKSYDVKKIDTDYFDDGLT